MKISVSDLEINLEQNLKKSEFISQVLNTIISICKFDKNFQRDIPESKIDLELIELKNKNKKQDELLKKSNKLLQSINEKNKILEREIYSDRIRILEKLGSEL